jgi:tetratricopeptide (TPR) repeat protein
LGNLGRFDEAIAAYNKIVAIRPGSERAWFRRGGILEKLGQFKEAFNSYGIALEIKQNYTEAIEARKRLEEASE